MIGGKAFSTYTNAKRIVKLVNDVGAVVNNDPEVNNYLKVRWFDICTTYFDFLFLGSRMVKLHTVLLCAIGV